MAKQRIQLMRPDYKGMDSQIDEAPYYKFFQLNKISIALDIPKDKIYNNFSGNYNSLDNGGDRKRIAKFMRPHVEAFFNKLGFKVSFEKLDEPT